MKFHADARAFTLLGYKSSLTDNDEFGVGPDGLVESRRAHLALILRIVLQGRVADPQVVDPVATIAQHRVSGESCDHRRKA